MDGDKLVSLLFPSPRFMSTTMPLPNRDSCSDTYSCTVFGNPSPPCFKSSSPSMDELGHQYSPNPLELPVVGSDSPTRQEPPSPTSTTSIPRDVPRVPRSEEASLIDRPTYGHRERFRRNFGFRRWHTRQPAPKGKPSVFHVRDDRPDTPVLFRTMNLRKSRSPPSATSSTSRAKARVPRRPCPRPPPEGL